MSARDNILWKKKQKEFEEKYGMPMTPGNMDKAVRLSLGAKFKERCEMAEQEKKDWELKYNLPYGELVKAVKSTAQEINDLKDKPKQLRDAERARLELEFDNLVEIGQFSSNQKELWVSEKLNKYMQSDEYMNVKYKLSELKKDHAIYLANKENWEKENSAIIEAERNRTIREELLQADPEALKALGISPVIVNPEKPAPKKK